MKVTGISLLICTSFILALLVVLIPPDFPFAFLFYLMCFGQLLLILSVYKVLTDKYSTKKTFDDFYED